MQAARETGALKEAKDKLEKCVEELTWRLDIEKHMRVNLEEAKGQEILKLQNALQEMQGKLDEAHTTIIHEKEAAKITIEQAPLVIKEVPVVDNTKLELHHNNDPMTQNASSRLNFKVKLAATGRKRSKKTTDPLKPRRPPSAFFVFMSEFRVKYSHSNKISGVSVEKAPYFAKVGKMKEEYEKIKRAYNDAEKKKEEDYEEIIRAYNVRLPGDYGTVFTPVSTTKKINLMADTSSHGRSLKMLEMRSFPSTSSANESSSSVEIRGVQSKLSGSHATPTQSFDSCQPIATILPENYASGDDNYASDDEDDQTVIDEVMCCVLFSYHDLLTSLTVCLYPSESSIRS
ncbi:hypothetical protein RYX36_030386 [Vicia faba]